MTNSIDNNEETVDADGASDDTELLVIRLGDLNDNDIITEAGLGQFLRRHKSSVKRAVDRGELPPPTRLCGMPVWTVRSILSHFERRLEWEAKDVERTIKRIEAQSP